VAEKKEAEVQASPVGDTGARGDVKDLNGSRDVEGSVAATKVGYGGSISMLNV